MPSVTKKHSTKVIRIKNEFDKCVNTPVKLQHEIASYTSWRVGGPAEYLAIVKTPKELEDIFLSAHSLGVQTTILGSGTNVLVSDKGIKGLVIINQGSGVDVLEEIHDTKSISEKYAVAQEDHWRGGLLKWGGLEFSGVSDTVVRINVQSGTVLGFLINSTLKSGITGLEFFSRIPGTVGGAIWDNIHGWQFLLEEFIENVTFLDERGEKQTWDKSKLDFGYNKSYFQRHSCLIQSAVFTLYRGNLDIAKQTAREWTERKSIQPFNSAGSVFSNLDPEYAKTLGIENLSGGFIVDKILGLRGFKIGDAWVSEKHANFIETGERARAQDVLDLIDLIKQRALEKGIVIKEEVNKLGFDD